MIAVSKTKALFFGIVYSLGIGSPALAAVYTADFSGTTLDSSLAFASNGGSVSVGGGSATISYSAVGGSATINPVIYTNFNVAGDYTAIVTANFSGLPSITSGIYTDFNLLEHTAGGYSAIGGLNDASAYLKAFYANPLVVETGREAGSSPVTLKLERAGDVITESYELAGSSIFNILGVDSGSSFLGPTSLQLAVFYNGTGPATGSVTFSNFSITTPTVSAVPEPAAWALMLIGFGAIGGALRNRRQSMNAALA